MQETTCEKEGCKEKEEGIVIQFLNETVGKDCNRSNNRLFLEKDGPYLRIYNPKREKVLRYNLISKEMERKDRHGKFYPTKQQYIFFQGFRIDDIVCSDEKFVKLLMYSRSANPLCRSISTFLDRLSEVMAYENFINSGIQIKCSKYDKLTKPLDFYSKHIIEFFKKTGITLDRDIEKRFIEHQVATEKLIYALEKIDIETERKRDFFEDMTKYLYDHYFTLVCEYNYDTYSLINYLLNYLEQFENVRYREAIRLLDDYYRMARLIDRKVKKYPKYLKSMHDIIEANYNSFKEVYDEKLFKRLRKKELDYKGKMFCIVTPQTSKEVVKEGTSLNHCVSSYIKKILEGKTYIFFLRHSKTPDESLITLELLNGKVAQAKGSYNRATTKDEYNFLKKYCERKKLGLSPTIGFTEEDGGNNE